MFIVGVVFFVAIQAIENGEIARNGMAVGTSIPSALVGTTIDREIHSVMIKSGRLPFVLSMTLGTISRETYGRVIRTGVIVITFMTAKAVSRRQVDVITIMASSTIISDLSMCAIEGIKLIVNVESSWHPIEVQCMALGAIIGKAKLRMGWILRFVEICLMTIDTIRRGIHEGIAGMTSITILNVVA